MVKKFFFNKCAITEVQIIFICNNIILFLAHCDSDKRTDIQTERKKSHSKFFFFKNSPTQTSVAIPQM